MVDWVGLLRLCCESFLGTQMCVWLVRALEILLGAHIYWPCCLSLEILSWGSSAMFFIVQVHLLLLEALLFFFSKCPHHILESLSLSHSIILPRMAQMYPSHQWCKEFLLSSIQVYSCMSIKLVCKIIIISENWKLEIALHWIIVSWKWGYPSVWFGDLCLSQTFPQFVP